jgi:hypothetical protein
MNLTAADLITNCGLVKWKEAVVVTQGMSLKWHMATTMANGTWQRRTANGTWQSKLPCAVCHMP